MHQRTFARVAPMRAKVFFYGCALDRGVSHVAALRRAGAARSRATRARRSRSVPDTVEVFARRGSILDRNGNVLVRSLPSESVYAVPHDLARSGCRRRPSCRAIFGKLDPAVVARCTTSACGSSGSRARCRTSVAERVRALDAAGHRSSRKKIPACASTPRPARIDACSVSSAPTKTGSTASSTPYDARLARPLGQRRSSRPTSSAARFRSGARRVIKPAQPGLELSS